MKTLLMWGVGSDFSTRAAQKLAADGHRLLLVGEDRQVLDELDATLVQSELHRVVTGCRLNELGTWVQEQNVGLDGLVVFPPTPAAHPNLFVPLAINLRSTESSVFGIVELIRELLPALRRGKRPKRILVVLDWHKATGLAPLSLVLTETWQALLPTITVELNKEGSHLNVLSLRESTEPLPVTAPQLAIALPPDPPSLKAPGSTAVEAALGSPEANAPPVSEFVQTAVSLISMYFSPTMQFLNGQFLQHPSLAAVSGLVSPGRQ